MKKLNLKQIKVESFVTNENKFNAQTINGGRQNGSRPKHDAVPVDYDWVLGSRGGCSNWENMCNDTAGPRCA